MLCQAENSVLFAIDMQTKLVDTIPEQSATRTLRNLEILLQAANLIEIPVIATEQYPQGLGQTDPRVSLNLPNTSERFEKTRFSCCGADGIGESNSLAEADQVVLAGLETHVCILQTAMELQESGKQVFIPGDAVCSRNDYNYRNALARMREIGVIITSTESVVFEWLRDSTHPQFKAISRLIR